jgi:hypothetical protein
MSWRPRWRGLGWSPEHGAQPGSRLWASSFALRLSPKAGGEALQQGAARGLGLEHLPRDVRRLQAAPSCRKGRVPTALKQRLNSRKASTGRGTTPTGPGAAQRLTIGRTLSGGYGARRADGGRVQAAHAVIQVGDGHDESRRRVALPTQRVGTVMCFLRGR